jgi:hypothetical protein
MSISTPPPPAPAKKRGMGCFGCGCLVLVLLVIIIGVIVGAGGYIGYKKALGLTSETPAEVPAITPSEDVYTAAKQKLTDFSHNVKNHQATTLQLSADDINTIIARDPDAVKNNIHAFVSFSGQEGRVQASMPLEALSQGLFKGRYANLDASFEVRFDTATKSVNLIGPDAPDAKSAQTFMNSFTPAFNQQFNLAIRKNPDAAALLDQTKSIEIQNGELVIETQ